MLVGTPMLNNRMLPTVASFLMYLKGLQPKNRLALTFGYNRIAQLTVEVEKNIDAGFDIILKIYEEMKLELNALEEILKNEK